MIPAYIPDIQHSLLIAESLDSNDGYTWTVASRLGSVLRFAEDMFGPRNKDWTILGVEFSMFDGPQVWFPGNCNHILIQLSRHAITNVRRAIFELAHEVIHCISPIGKKNSNYLEEGLGYYLAEKYMGTLGWETFPLNKEDYIEAFTLATQLMDLNSEIVKNCRVIQPVIGHLKPVNLTNAEPRITIELANQLCRKFNSTAV